MQALGNQLIDVGNPGGNDPGGWKGQSWINPLGYLLFHKDPPYTNPYIKQLVGMAQGDWDYFQQNIQPTQQKLLNAAMGPDSINQAVDQAREGVSQQFANVPAAFNREMQSRGISVTPDQQASFAKESGLREGVANVGASNMARETAYRQQRGILLGGGG